MPSLADTLASIPGYGAYVARRQMNEQQPMRELQQAGGVLSLQKIIEQQGQEAQLRKALAESGGDPDAALKAALVSGNVGAASKLSPIIQARETAATRKEAQAQRAQQFVMNLQLRQETLDQRREEFLRRTEDAGERTKFEQWYKGESLKNRQAQDAISNQLRAQGIELQRQGLDLRRDIAGLSDTSVTSPAPQASGESVPAGAIPEGVNAPAATGGSGFFGNIANTVADMVGAGMPYPKVEQGSQALTNLRIRTVTMAQDAIPGRPSNYLMQQLDKLAVQPNSLLMADQRAKVRFEQTRDMLKQEAARMERDILQRPRGYTAAVLAKTRNSHSQLKQLVGEYDTVIQSFEGKGPAVSGSIKPPSGFTLD